MIRFVAYTAWPVRKNVLQGSCGGNTPYCKPSVIRFRGPRTGAPRRRKAEVVTDAVAPGASTEKGSDQRLSLRGRALPRQPRGSAASRPSAQGAGRSALQEEGKGRCARGPPHVSGFPSRPRRIGRQCASPRKKDFRAGQHSGGGKPCAPLRERGFLSAEKAWHFGKWVRSF